MATNTSVFVDTVRENLQKHTFPLHSLQKNKQTTSKNKAISRRDAGKSQPHIFPPFSAPLRLSARNQLVVQRALAFYRCVLYAPKPDPC